MLKQMSTETNELRKLAGLTPLIEEYNIANNEQGLRIVKAVLGTLFTIDELSVEHDVIPVHHTIQRTFKSINGQPFNDVAEIIEILHKGLLTISKEHDLPTPIREAIKQPLDLLNHVYYFEA